MTAPKYNMGDDVVAVVRGRVTAVTEYAAGYFSYRITGTEPAGDRYNKFVDEKFVLPAGAVADAEIGEVLPEFVTRTPPVPFPTLARAA